jgi:glyoxylase-like metal-dependent hydrolase (beta-lactamase superfamily II)
MQQLAQYVYMEDHIPGVTLGAINLPHGLIQIDAPPSPDDGRTWRATLMNLGGGVERMIVNLDSHPDRTLGVRAMDCTVVAQEKTAAVFRNRPNTFKASGDETGAEWEHILGIGSIRWAPPDIFFTEQMSVNWSNVAVVLQHRPGPTSGAIWVSIPDKKVVFIGDAVVKNQPPFLASADIPAWLAALNVLGGKEYKDYDIVSGRGGVVTQTQVKALIDYLKQVQKDLEKLANKSAAPEATEKLINNLLALTKTPVARQKQYAQRLRYGLRHYYTRHYHPSKNGDNDE